MKKIVSLTLAVLMLLGCMTVTTFADSYQVQVMGNAVTSENQDNILGDGKVSYNPETNTLTLNGATINKYNDNAPIVSNYAKPLIIKLIGDNSITATACEGTISCNNSTKQELIITGTGSLKINQTRGGSQPINNWTKLKVEDGVENITITTNLDNGVVYFGTEVGSLDLPEGYVALASENTDETDETKMKAAQVEGRYVTIGGVTYAKTLVIHKDPNKKGDSSNIKATVGAFSYEMVIPTETTLTEAAHKDVALGGDGKVSVEKVKHASDKTRITYTVDQTDGQLKNADKSVTIETTYKVAPAGEDAAALAADTKVTVYESNSVKDSTVTVNVTDEKWNAAPTGDYNATLIFNFVAEEVDPVTVADILETVENFPTSRDGSLWTNDSGSKLYVLNDKFKASTSDGQNGVNFELDYVLTEIGEGQYKYTDIGFSAVFMINDGKLQSVTIDGIPQVNASLKGTYTYKTPVK